MAEGGIAEGLEDFSSGVRNYADDQYILYNECSDT
jgi:hypothetical protein